jgi:hypothetical protein
MPGGIFCGHVAVVPCHEKAMEVANACVMEHAADSGMEVWAASGVLGMVVSGEQGLGNEAAGHAEQGMEVNGDRRVENEAAVHGEQGVGDEAAEHGKPGVRVNGDRRVGNEAAVHGKLVAVHGE